MRSSHFTRILTFVWRHFHEVVAFWTHFDAFRRHFIEVVAFWTHFDVFQRHFHEVVAFWTFFDIFRRHFHEVVAFQPCSLRRAAAERYRHWVGFGMTMSPRAPGVRNTPKFAYRVHSIWPCSVKPLLRNPGVRSHPHPLLFIHKAPRIHHSLSLVVSANNNKKTKGSSVLRARGTLFWPEIAGEFEIRWDPGHSIGNCTRNRFQ